MRPTITLLTALLVSAPSFAAPPALDQARYQADLKMIASDEFEGRGPASVGEQRFVPWLVEQYKAIGLKPGNGKSYTQAVPMYEISTSQLSDVTLVHAGKSSVLPAKTGVILESLRLDPKVEVKNAPLVFLGYGVDSKGERWHDYEGVDVRGKIVVVLVNDPGFHANDAKLFNGKAMTYAGRWSYKFEEAARRGALGCLIVHDDAGASYGWQVLVNGAGQPAFALPQSAKQPAPLAVQGWLSAQASENLFKTAGLDFIAQRTAAGKRGFKAVPLNTTLSVKLQQKIRKTESQNVLGLIEGSEKPDEVVIYSAHWDHLGKDPALPGDGIYNGALDNGTGVAGLLELGRSFKQARPKRSVLMLAVTLEEALLLGSRYYAENPVFPLNKTLANLNMDALPLIGPSKDVVAIGFGNSELEDIAKRLAALQNRVLVPEPQPENGFYFRSDHFSFAKLGVPALYIKTGFDHAEKGKAYGQAWMDTYNRERYHKPGDEYDANADYRGLMMDLQLLRDVGLEVANAKRWPQWYPKSEFRREERGR